VKDADLLSDLATRLSDHVEDLSAAWAQRLLLQLAPSTQSSSRALEAIAWVNTWYLEDHLARLRERRIDAVLHDSFERHLRLLRSQCDASPELRLTLPQLYLSLEISSSLFAEWAQRLFAGDDRLPAILAAIGRLALHLGQTVSQAFHEVRSEELQDALRVSSALHEAGVELNTRSASVASVVSHLARMVARMMRCNRTLTFLWNPEENAYAPADGFGITAMEMAELASVRFRPGDVPIMDPLLRGESVSGTREDGRVSREMMERYGSFSYALAPLVGSRGEPLGVLAAYRGEPRAFSSADLRILDGVARNAALALENARLVEQLEAAARLKSEFINSMSHEMRTPLNVIFGYLEMLGDHVGEGGQGTMLIERIHRNAGHLVKLVNTLLDIGRIDTGRMPINVETFGVDHVFDDLQQVFTPVAETRGLVFECEAAGNLGELTTDRLKLVEILNNLLSNAFKFTDTGRIGLRARLSNDGDRIRFEVADTGVGLEPSTIPIVFDLFRQAGAGDRGGAGLGLYIVKRLTELLRGDIDVDSGPGRGSCFAVEIPRILAA
jgi:signal transduction histidine kinase